METLGLLSPGDVFTIDGNNGVLWMVLEPNQYLEPKPKTPNERLVVQITTGQRIEWHKSKAGTPWRFSNKLSVTKVNSPFNVTITNDNANRKLLAIQNILNE